MVYFVSDAHLGSLLVDDNRAHEKKFVAWLDKVKLDAEAIYLLGDIFDFWFEYKTVVPKGYVRFLGKLAELVDAGIEIHFFTGNHDLWTFGYLEKEVGLIVHRKPETVRIGTKNFFLAHGDGLYGVDKGFKILRTIFHSQFAQTMFRYFPIQWGQEFGYRWSRDNRIKGMPIENKFRGEDQEYLVIYAKKYVETHKDIDFLVFGHRHIDIDLMLKDKNRVVILGDFVSIFSYGVFDGENFWLDYFN